ncbi:type I pullulanase, partial [Clostridium sp.]|uniref:type I pullulanase n=1 Tax=Clostridium sp. TaxID=1506 RepID=UPI0028421921
MKTNQKKFLSIILVFAIILPFFMGTISAKAATSGTSTIKIHYLRADNNYANWNLSVVNNENDANGSEYEFTGKDEDGVFTAVTVQSTTSAAVMVKNDAVTVQSTTSAAAMMKNDSGKILVDTSQGDVDVYITTDAQNNTTSNQKPLEFKYNKVNIRVHYFRFDGDYKSWDVWSWVNDVFGGNYAFNSSDDYGAEADYTVENEKMIGVRNVGIIIRHPDWSAKDGSQDRFMDLAYADKNGNLDAYLLQNEPNIYYSAKQVDKASSIDSATMSSFKTIKFSVNSAIEDKCMVKLMNGETVIDGNVTLSEDKKSGVITTTNNLDFNKKYKVVIDGFKGGDVTLGSDIYTSDDFNNAYAYNGNDLGFTYSKDKTIFKVWAPTANKVSLNLYKEGSGDNLIETIPMTQGDKGVWSADKEGDLAGTFYTYNVTVNDKTNETQDVYSKAVGVNGNRSMVVDLSATNPEDWSNDKGPKIKNQTDAIIYEVHIRDISMDPNSGIKMKGKFLGLTETGTKSAEGELTGIDHLKELGINAIHILPSFDYASIDETHLDSNKFNWGYDPKNFMSVEGSYSTDPYSGTLRIDEMKQMIEALHKAGIAVIMDSVYNHTSDCLSSSFDKTVPNYYFRQKDDGSLISNSGCGNDTASERAMYRKYMIDSVNYWAKEYHIDGFRFDLMGLHDIDTMNQIRSKLDEIDPNILMYGEGWNLGNEVTLTDDQKATKTNESKLNNRIAAFSDDMRDGVRGHVFNNLSGGFVNYNSKWKDGKGNPYTMAQLKEQVKFGIVASTEHDDIDYAAQPYGSQPWAKEPTQTVNYVSCHDNNTIWDRISLTQPDASEADKIKMDQMSAFIVLTSQGIPFLQEGQEMLGTKPDPSGTGVVDNSYNSPDSVNQIDWKRKNTYKNVVNYYEGLIKLRKAHPAFRMPTTVEIQQNLKFFNTNESTIGYTISNNANGDKWKGIAVVINAGTEDTEVTLPASNWTVVVEGEKAGTDAIKVISGNKVVVPARTSMVLADTASFNGINGNNSSNNSSRNNNSSSNNNNINSNNNANINNEKNAVGWKNINGTWYNYDSNGNMKTGWINDNGTWYYMQPSGEMKTGWINDNGTWYYMQPSGEMKTGWI